MKKFSYLILAASNLRYGYAHKPASDIINPILAIVKGDD
jgi:hypothetical protein